MSKEIAVPKYVPEIHFNFPNKEKKTPDNFDDLQVDDEITVTVKGKVRSIRHDSDERSFGMTFPRVRLAIPETSPTSIASAMVKAAEKRKL